MYAAKLTVPDEIRETVDYYPTGNDYVALPLINEGGAVESVNVLHMGCKGMVEFYGTPSAPLLAPVVRIGGREMEFPTIKWERLEHWIPRLTAVAAGLRVTGTIYAPPGHRGFVYSLHIENISEKAVALDWGWRGCWAEARQAVYRSRPLHGRRTAWYDRWTDTLALEMSAGPAVAGIALGASRPFPGLGWHLATSASPGAAFQNAVARRGGPMMENPLCEDNERGRPIYFAIAQETVLQPAL